MGIFKSTVSLARVQYKGHEIVFENAWSLVKSLATLQVDGVEVARSPKMVHLNPHEPLFSLQNVAPDIETIDVFFIGVFSVKCSIVVNGEVLHQDPIDRFDKMQAKWFEKDTA